MIIGVDLRALDKNSTGGIQEYILRLVPELVRLDRTIKFKLFYNSYRWQIKGWLDNEPNVEWHQFSYPNRWLLFSGRMFYGPKLDELVGRAEVWFSPHFFVTPLSPHCRQVLTFHDLSWLRYPEFFTRQQNWWHRWQAPGLQARRASRLIAVSQSTAADLQEFYAVLPEKISVIHSGIGTEFFASSPRFDLGELALTEKYFLYLGTVEPRKNVAAIIRAFDQLKASTQIDSDAHLVIAGKLGWDFAEVQRLVNHSLWHNQIKLIGPVERAAMPELYRHARVFVYPSFFEGFGFPPLEAMASGVPVVAGNNSSFPETLSNAALLVDPHSQTELVTAMATAWNDENLRTKLIETGKTQAQNFNWQKTAAETLAVLISGTK